MITDLEALSAMQRSERALGEQISQWEPLDYGVAYCSPAFPTLADANQLRDIWLADTDGETAYVHAESYYRERHLTCRRWTPAASQPPEPLEAVLIPKGWRRCDHAVMKLANADLTRDPADVSIRILPARAMPNAFRQTFADGAPRADARASLVYERLNDSNYDIFIAMVDDQPAGRIGYLEVGDIARLADLFVLPKFRRRGVGLTLTAHFLRLARRLLPRAVVTCTEAENDAGTTFLARCGFSPAGSLTEFDRPPDA